MTPRDGLRRRVLLVDDEGMSRGLLASLLTSAEYEVVVAATAAEAIATFRRFDPDVLVVDIDLGAGPSGLDLVLAISKKEPTLPIIVLSNYAMTADYRNGPAAHALYLSKHELVDTDVLLDALDALLRDGRPDAIAGEPAASAIDALTDAQLQLLRMIAQGLSNEEIAHRRGSTVRAVEHLVRRTFQALGIAPEGARNARVTAAMIYARAAGIPPAIKR